MIAHGEGGHVVNTASMAGLGSAPGNVVYSTSKFAVVGLSEGLRKELAGEKIGVTVLCPGAVRTNFNRNGRNRPAQYAEQGTDLSEDWYKLLDESFEAGTSPRELGDMVVDAIKGNKPYVLPHSEFKDGYKKKIDEILAGWSDEPPDPKRTASAKSRQAAFGLMTNSTKGVKR
jgi:short-subunit dehydrogenase